MCACGPVTPTLTCHVCSIMPSKPSSAGERPHTLPPGFQPVQHAVIEEADNQQPDDAFAYYISSRLAGPTPVAAHASSARAHPEHVVGRGGGAAGAYRQQNSRSVLLASDEDVDG